MHGCLRRCPAGVSLEVLEASYEREMDDYKEMGIISSRYHPDRFDRTEGKEGGAAFTEKRPPEFWAIRGREARLWPELIEGCELAATARQEAREKSGDDE